MSARPAKTRGKKMSGARMICEIVETIVSDEQDRKGGEHTLKYCKELNMMAIFKS